MSNGKVVPKSTQVYSRGLCGPRPKFPDPHVQDHPALGSREKEDFDKGIKLKKDTFIDMDKNSRALWAHHEDHPFKYRTPAEIPSKPEAKKLNWERKDRVQLDDKDYAFRLNIRYASNLPKGGTRKRRAFVRVGLLHHDVCTKADDLNGTDPVWNQTLLLPFVRTNAIFFTVCDRGQGMTSTDTIRETDKPIGYGMWQLGEWLKTGQATADPEITLEIQNSGSETESVGKLKFSIEKVLATPNMDLHRDEYDPAVLRNYKGMPPAMKDYLFSAPDQL